MSLCASAVTSLSFSRANFLAAACSKETTWVIAAGSDMRPIPATSHTVAACFVAPSGAGTLSGVVLIVVRSSPGATSWSTAYTITPTSPVQYGYQLGRWLAADDDFVAVSAGGEVQIWTPHDVDDLTRPWKQVSRVLGRGSGVLLSAKLLVYGAATLANDDLHAALLLPYHDAREPRSL